jgi:hypothetical protein
LFEDFNGFYILVGQQYLLMAEVFTGIGFEGTDA